MSFCMSFKSSWCIPFSWVGTLYLQTERACYLQLCCIPESETYSFHALLAPDMHLALLFIKIIPLGIILEYPQFESWEKNISNCCFDIWCFPLNPYTKNWRALFFFFLHIGLCFLGIDTLYWCHIETQNGFWRPRIFRKVQNFSLQKIRSNICVFIYESHKAFRASK